MITLFLMGQKGLSVLNELVAGGYSGMIDKVIAARDRNVVNDYYEDIRQTAMAGNVCFFDRTEDFIISSRYCIAISWRWLIHLPSGSELIVLHDSLLPKYRGFAPLVNMLINHEPAIGVSAIIASDEFDKGPVIAQASCPVQYPVRVQDAIEMLAPKYSELVVEIFKRLDSGAGIEAVPQVESEASFSLWRDEEDYRINWDDSSEDIRQFVYSVGYPYKGASCLCDGELLRIIDCEPYPDVVIENRVPGKLLFMVDGCPVIVCGRGLLKITKLENDRGDNMLPLHKFRVRLK